MKRMLMIVILMLLVSAACNLFRGNPDSVLRSQKMNRGNTLVIGVFEETSADSSPLDWNLSANIVTKIFATNTMEGLTSVDTSTPSMKVSPALATKWSTNDNVHFTFKLDQTKKWSDGISLRAEDFVYAIQRVLDPSHHSPCALSLFTVKNAKAFLDGKVKEFSEVGVRAPDPGTLQITLSEPAAYFPSVLAESCLFPARKDLIEKFGEHWTEPAHLVTLGAFKLVDFKKGRHLVLKRQKQEGANLLNVVCYLGLHGPDAKKLFEDAQLDALINIPATEYDHFSQFDDLTMNPKLNIVYLSFDVKKKPLSNPIFRRVIGMAIDRKEVVRSLGGGLQPMGVMIPPGLIGYESNRGVRFDAEAAAELLKKSSHHKAGEAQLSLVVTPEMAAGANGQDAALSENIQAQLRRNLNLDLKIVKSGKDPLSLSKAKDADNDDDAADDEGPRIYLSRFKSETPDPDSFLVLFRGNSSLNSTGWKNRNYDDFLKKAAATDDPESREKTYAKAQHILNDEEMPVIPLYVETTYVLLRKRVHDFPVNVARQMPLESVTLE